MFSMINCFPFYISPSARLSIKICHWGIYPHLAVTGSSPCVTFLSFFLYLCACRKGRVGGEMMENTHLKTNNRLFPLSRLAFTCSNHLKGKTAKTVLSIASLATAADTPRPPFTALRCFPTTPPPKHRLWINRTTLGRKSQIHSKFGPSPGACMKADVSIEQVWLLRLRCWQPVWFFSVRKWIY